MVISKNNLYEYFNNYATKWIHTKICLYCFLQTHLVPIFDPLRPENYTSILITEVRTIKFTYLSGYFVCISSFIISLISSSFVVKVLLSLQNFSWYFWTISFSTSESIMEAENENIMEPLQIYIQSTYYICLSKHYIWLVTRRYL